MRENPALAVDATESINLEIAHLTTLRGMLDQPFCDNEGRRSIRQRALLARSVMAACRDRTLVQRFDWGVLTDVVDDIVDKTSDLVEATGRRRKS